MEIRGIIQKLGIFQKHLGYRYLCYGLELALRNEDYLLLLTKALYPDIALRFHTTANCVEHNIRNAIQTAWHKKQTKERMEAMAGYKLIKCPSNGEVFCILVSYCQRIGVEFEEDDWEENTGEKTGNS